MADQKNKNKSKKAIDYKIRTLPLQVKPFVYKNASISELTIKMLVMLLIQVLMLALTKSFSALSVVGTALLASVIATAINCLVSKSQLYTNLSMIVQGLLVGMLLPESFPLLTVFLITFSVLFISKYLFGNSVNAWLNIVCLAIIIAWFIGRNYFPGYLITSDILTVKNPSAYMIQNGIFPVYEFDSVITNFLNANIFTKLKVNLPEGFISILWDTKSVIPAFRFNLLTILASVIIFSDDSSSGLVPAVFLITYGIMVRIFFPFFAGSGQLNTGDLILAFCTSGTLFIAVFVFQWFGTLPMTISGKIIYGIIAGLLAFLIVGCGTSPVGMVYTVLICNVINLIINLIEEQHKDSFDKKLVAEKLK